MKNICLKFSCIILINKKNRGSRWKNWTPQTHFGLFPNILEIISWTALTTLKNQVLQFFFAKKVKVKNQKIERFLWKSCGLYLSRHWNDFILMQTNWFGKFVFVFSYFQRHFQRKKLEISNIILQFKFLLIWRSLNSMFF